MLRKFEYFCLIGSLALIGADRIDLLGGHGPLRLTPFLFCASLIVLMHLVEMGLRGRFQVTIHPTVRRQVPFLIVLALFLFTAFTSTILGEDPQRGLMPLCDLVLLAVLGYFLSVRIVSDPAPQELVVRSVTFALTVYLLF